MKSGIELIAEERQRQIDVEKYSAENDSNYTIGELAMAGACYAIPNHIRLFKFDKLPYWWPFGSDSWKPTPRDRRRELVKAGALIAAEIDRLNALEEAAGEI